MKSDDIKCKGIGFTDKLWIGWRNDIDEKSQWSYNNIEYNETAHHSCHNLVDKSSIVTLLLKDNQPIKNWSGNQAGHCVDAHE